jgi:hypothetical protein
MSNNMEIYNKFRQVPKEAQKTIGAGRLKGFTDINPQWRIQALTEMFGACGFGWKYIITDKRIVEGADGVSCAFVDIDLFIKVNDQWSEAIQGTGGSSFVASERNGLYTSDECFKMALTDAISVACKALGIGADVYWSAGRTKYDTNTEQPKEQKPKEKTPRERLIAKLKEKGINVSDYAKEKNLQGNIPDSRFEELLKELG